MKVDACPLCEAVNCEVFLQRVQVPVHQNLLASSPSEARNSKRGDLAISLCTRCGFVFNAAFRQDFMSYCQGYDSAQAHSPLFRKYLIGIADDLVERYRLVGQTVVEVGCGKGDFLQLLCAEGRNRGIGFDPSYVGPETTGGGIVHFISEPFGGQHASPAPTLLCCRHVIEHIPNPLQMLGEIRKALGEGSNAIVYFETPDVEWILENVAFWDFFYEHCSYFGLDTLKLAFEKAGFSVLSVRHVFGAQYLAVEAKATAPREFLPLPSTSDVRGLRKGVASFRHNTLRKIDECRNQVRDMAHNGGCALWGAAAKGVTFANVIDPDVAEIKCVVDVSPAKAGRFVPGTGHPIVSLEALGRHYSVAGLLSMNPNYLQEQRAMLSALALPITVEALR